MALAHELDHALTDQHFDFGPRQDALDRADAQDELLALDSLVESDAVLLQNRWMAKYMTDAGRTLMVPIYRRGIAPSTRTLNHPASERRDGSSQICLWGNQEFQLSQDGHQPCLFGSPWGERGDRHPFE
jgi:hypothetical protein